jgi:hypothetical protein
MCPALCCCSSDAPGHLEELSDDAPWRSCVSDVASDVVGVVFPERSCRPGRTIFGVPAGDWVECHDRPPACGVALMG